MRRKQLWVSLIATTVIAFGSLIAVIATSTHPQLGLDLQGGASVTLTPVGKFDSGAPATTAPGTATTVPGATTTTAPARPIDASILTPLDQDKPTSTVILSNRDGTQVYQLGPAFALGESAISSASAELQNGEWQV